MSVIYRIQNACRINKVCYWQRHGQAKKVVFDQVIRERLSEIEELKWSPREAGCADHPEHDVEAEDKVFSGKITYNHAVNLVVFYIKGYFWKKSDIQADQGVTIQSFRIER